MGKFRPCGTPTRPPAAGAGLAAAGVPQGCQLLGDARPSKGGALSPRNKKELRRVHAPGVRSAAPHPGIQNPSDSIPSLKTKTCVPHALGTDTSWLAGGKRRAHFKPPVSKPNCSR